MAKKSKKGQKMSKNGVLMSHRDPVFWPKMAFFSVFSVFVEFFYNLINFLQKRRFFVNFIRVGTILG
jgi:hypothetical protein